ncbi:hypothetical protein [Pseudomonas sp. SLFW]|uniref:hypothetical protein n=1 Tax=Pseudomonas sp. SLFW TaxID=2683259 RepID=UPI0014134F40|nr:hypothetical protein [Pseudomonas sp. SLFW]NBB11884.1 hypothetical protein [Pseudomonas sp. SLFW]
MLVPLPAIKRDLEETAVHLERLSQSMAGHLAYATFRQPHQTHTEIAGNIRGIHSSVQQLKAAAARID